MFEGDGALVEEAEKLCKYALPIVIADNDGIWCAKTSFMCFKCLGEHCDEEEFEEPITVF